MNKYCNLDGYKKIKDDFQNINIGFDRVEEDVDKINNDVKNIDDRVDTIITTPVEGVSAQEIVDARKGKPTLGDKIQSIDDDLNVHTQKSIHKGEYPTFNVTSTDNATSVTNAPLKTAGGGAVTKDLRVGGAIWGDKYLGNIFGTNYDISNYTQSTNWELKFDFVSSFDNRFVIELVLVGSYFQNNRNGIHKYIISGGDLSQINDTIEVTKTGITGLSVGEVRKDNNSLVIPITHTTGGRVMVSSNGRSSQACTNIELNKIE